MSISLDDTRVLSNSTSCDVRAWDLDNGEDIDIVDQLHSDFWGQFSLTAVAFSLDGGQIVVGSYDHSVTVWDVQGKCTTKHVFGWHNGPVNSAAFSPSGESIASGSDDCTAQVWSLGGHTSASQPVAAFRHVCACQASPLSCILT